MHNKVVKMKRGAFVKIIVVILSLLNSSSGCQVESNCPDSRYLIYNQVCGRGNTIELQPWPAVVPTSVCWCLPEPFDNAISTFATSYGDSKIQYSASWKGNNRTVPYFDNGNPGRAWTQYCFHNTYTVNAQDEDVSGVYHWWDDLYWNGQIIYSEAHYCTVRIKGKNGTTTAAAMEAESQISSAYRDEALIKLIPV